VNLLEFIRILFRNWKVLVFLPALTALVVFILTRNTKKEYVSSTQVYTGIASGYGITSGENDRVDYFAVNNAFDNLMATIKSRETMEEVGLRLLALHILIEKPAYNQISPENFEQLHEIIPQELRKKFVVKGSPEQTYMRIAAYRRSSQNNEIVKLLNSTSIYSAGKISSSMSANRKQSSDMIELSYRSNDPAVCQQTLQYLVNVVIERYKNIKGTETGNVVKYFEEQLRLSALRLRKSEDNLRDYSSRNKIINYDEQAKFVAESKEDVTMDKQKQQMALEASRSALSKIEDKIELKKNILEINQNLVQLKEQLTQVNYKIANAELYAEDTANLKKYRQESEQIKSKIKEEVSKQYIWNNTPEGLPRMNILNEWLSNFIAVQENESKLEVIQKRLDGFDGIFSDLAPIGSNLKRIEREVDINEKEYLSVLHGLNMAKLRQQSLEMSNNLTITDYPSLPLEPEPSKRMMMVIMSFLATFILTMSFIVGKAFLGRTVQTPARAEKFTGLRFLSAFPAYNKLDKTILKEELDNALMSHVMSSLLIQMNQTEIPEGFPPVICISSTKKGEGKTFTASKIASRYSERFGPALLLNPDEKESESTFRSTFYPKGPHYFNSKGIYEWLEQAQPDFRNYNIILLELDQLSRFNIPDRLLEGIALHIFILSGNRVWSESDSRALGLFNKLHNGKSLVLLNHIDSDRLESLIGEIPKKRSNFRRVAKQIVTFDFKRA
jgi:uncharacterized protein involved in exopolysaccharide biosynthesis